MGGAQALRLALLSDFNGSYGSVTYPAATRRSVERIIHEWRPDLVLTVGDLIAGQKASQTDAQVRAMWQGFDREVYAPLLRSGIPFAPAMGNHDASLPRDRAEAQRYWQAHLPALEYLDRRHFPFYYSYSLHSGEVFIAVLDAATPEVNETQRAWLTAQLASDAARKARFRLVVGHLPLAGISREKNRPGEILRGAQELRQIMERGKVTAYIHGHHAAYFAGKLGELNIISSGGIGGRDYVGYPGTARSVVTVLDVQPQAIHLSAFDADSGNAIQPEELPARIDGLGGPVTRVSELR